MLTEAGIYVLVTRGRKVEQRRHNGILICYLKEYRIAKLESIIGLFPPSYKISNRAENLLDPEGVRNAFARCKVFTDRRAGLAYAECMSDMLNYPRLDGKPFYRIQLLDFSTVPFPTTEDVEQMYELKPLGFNVDLSPTQEQLNRYANQNFSTIYSGLG
jgi:hypothetical protein